MGKIVVKLFLRMTTSLLSQRLSQFPASSYQGSSMQFNFAAEAQQPLGCNMHISKPTEKVGTHGMCFMCVHRRSDIKHLGQWLWYKKARS